MARVIATNMASPETSFEVNVSKDTFKFNAAHFVAYQGFRERLHGHNYLVSVRLLGSRKIGPDGYVIDYGCVKVVTKKVCKELNEHFLCPMRSDVIDITVEEGGVGGGSVILSCEDGSYFTFPKNDCAMLPIVHATTEELAIYLWGRILDGLNSDYLIKRGIHTMEVTVAEAIGQEAVFRMIIPEETSKVERESLSDVGTYIKNGDVVPMPCPSAPDTAPSKEKERKFNSAHTDGCTDACRGCNSKLSDKLQALADAINSGSLQSKKGSTSNEVQVKDLEAIMNTSR